MDGCTDVSGSDVGVGRILVGLGYLHCIDQPATSTLFMFDDTDRIAARGDRSRPPHRH
jgi:hypothetical protein